MFMSSASSTVPATFQHCFGIRNAEALLREAGATVTATLTKRESPAVDNATPSG